MRKIQSLGAFEALQSRRTFLGTLAGASAFAIGGCACPFGRQKVRLAAVGIMGKGFSDWFPMVQSGLAELVALCDADRGQLRKAQETVNKRGLPLDLSRLPFYTDSRRLLDDAAKLGIEAMTVSTPDHMHAPIAIRAMKAGIHVYVQKPLVRTLWELDYFRRTAAENAGGHGDEVAISIEPNAHYVEFLRAIRGEGDVYVDTHSRCFSDVEHSVPMMEGILVGCAAQLTPGVLAWDSAAQRFDNADANALIRPYVRPGWEF